MSILFSVIANREKIIFAHSSCEGNFVEIVSEVLSKIPNATNKMTYLHGKYLLNYIIDNGYVYMCVTDKVCQRSRAFLFLNEIKRLFQSEGKRNYSVVLEDEMLRYSQEYNDIRIEGGELDEINRIEVGCSESILGEKILRIKNEDNMEFSAISYVGRPPEKIILTVKNTDSYKILFIGLAFAVIMLCTLGPVTFIVVGIVLVYLLKRKKS